MAVWSHKYVTILCYITLLCDQCPLLRCDDSMVVFPCMFWNLSDLRRSKDAFSSQAATKAICCWPLVRQESRLLEGTELCTHNLVVPKGFNFLIRYPQCRLWPHTHVHSYRFRRPIAYSEYLVRDLELQTETVAVSCLPATYQKNQWCSIRYWATNGGAAWRDNLDTIV